MKGYKEIKELLDSPATTGIALHGSCLHLRNSLGELEPQDELFDIQAVLDGLKLDYGIDASATGGYARASRDNVCILITLPPVLDSPSVYLRKLCVVD